MDVSLEYWHNLIEVTIGVRYQCGQPNVNLRQVPAQGNE